MLNRKILLGLIRGYWRFTPMTLRTAMSTKGTSVAAYQIIATGEGSWLTFWNAALPLAKIYNFFGGTSHGNRDW